MIFYFWQFYAVFNVNLEATPDLNVLLLYNIHQSNMCCARHCNGL